MWPVLSLPLSLCTSILYCAGCFSCSPASESELLPFLTSQREKRERERALHCPALRGILCHRGARGEGQRGLKITWWPFFGYVTASAFGLLECFLFSPHDMKHLLKPQITTSSAVPSPAPLRSLNPALIFLHPPAFAERARTKQYDHLISSHRHHNPTRCGEW